MNYIRNEYLKAILAQIVVLLLSLILLNLIFQGFFVENIPQKNWLYILHGKLLIWQKTALILIFLVFFFSTSGLVKAAYNESEHLFHRLFLIVTIPVIYLYSSLIIQVLCGVPSIFYFKQSLIDFFKYFFSYSTVVILITFLQNKYIASPKESLIVHLMNKIRTFFKDKKND